LPSLSLSGSYRKSGDDWPPDTSSKSWSLSLSYSLFPGGSNVAERAIEGAQLDAAREDFARSVKDLRYSLQQAYQDYEDALEALEVTKISLAASQERAKITEVKYLNGLIGYDEWYRIENTSIQDQKSLLTSRKSALLAEASWHKTCGGYVQ
jgi:outer membrane protein TolC